MQSIYYEVDNEPVVLLVEPYKSPIITTEQYEKFIPLIMNQSVQKFNYNIENGIIKLDTDIETIKNLCYKCMKNISEKIIVEQEVTSNLPTIRHRPLYFGLSKDNTGIEIRFEELGDKNSIDKALSILNFKKIE
jgi:hypothetical protein